MNISSALLYADPAHIDTLRADVLAMPGVEIHAMTDDGRWVLTIESENDRTAVDTYQAIERLQGALSVAMIFQQTEPNPEQELSPCKSHDVI